MRSVQALARNSTNVPAIACPRDRYVDGLSWKCLVAIAPPSHLSRVLQSIRGRVRQGPRTLRRRDAALHGQGDLLEHCNERERSDRELLQADRCGASVLAGHDTLGSQMKKSVDVFLDPFVFSLNDNELSLDSS